MRIAHTKGNMKTMRATKKTHGGGKRKAHNIGRTYRNKMRGR